MRGLATWWKAVLVGAGLVLLAGCDLNLGDHAGKDPAPNGVATMSPRAALAAADRAMADLVDASYAGPAVVPLGPGLHVPADVAMTFARGGLCELSVRTRHRGSMTIRVVGGKSYSKVDAAFARNVAHVPAAVVREVSSKWVVADTDRSTRRICQATDSDLRYRRTFRAAGTASIGQRDARAFRGRSADGQVTVWIATEGDPVILRVEGGRAGNHYRLTLSATNQLDGIVAPPSSDILDVHSRP